MIELRPYQQRVQDETFAKWNAGFRNVMAVKPTGAGKSVLISDTVRKFDAQRSSGLIMAHRRELVGQMSLHIARQGVRHRIIAPKDVVSAIMAEHRRELDGQCYINPSAQIAVGGVDTIVSRMDVLKPWLRVMDFLVCDECFPAGTLIETEKGKRPIESLRIGEKVLTFDERSGIFDFRPITFVFKNKMPLDMVRLRINGHHVITCTNEHPFWTRRGWVSAKDLKTDDVLYVRKTRTGDALCETDRQGLLQQGMLQSVLRQTIIGNDGADESEICIRSNERAEPDDADGRATEGVGYTAAFRPQADSPGRERENPTDSGDDSFTSFRTARICSSISDQDRETSGFRLSDHLQTGLRTSGVEGCFGSGRTVASGDRASISGSKERPVFEWVRLDSVEIFQPNHHGKPDLSATNGYVYNIEVEEFSTYVANDIVVHNCHHVQKTNKWGKVFEEAQRALGLLVTATPQRGDGHGLGRGELIKPAILDQYGRVIEPAEYDGDGVVDAMVIGPQMRELIDIGALTDYEIVCPPTDFDMSKLREGEEDFTRASLKEAANSSPKLVGDIVENYCKYAFGKRAVVFATDVETSGKIAQQFLAWGIPAASISAETDSAVRDDVIRRLRDGRLWVVCNVDLLGEGFDLPAIECVIMARPTASLAVYMQQFGRALRPMVGKLFGLVIDHVSNIKRFGFPDKPRVWSLDRRQKRAPKEKDPELVDVLICPNTGRPYEAIYIAACPHCKGPDGITPGNHVKPAGTGGSIRAVEVVAGDLTRLTADQLAELRRIIHLPDPNDVHAPMAAGAGAAAGQRNLAFAHIQAQRELRDAINEWAGYQKHGLGRDDSELFRRFYHATGFDVVSVLGGSRQEMIAMTERIRGWLTSTAA